MCCALKVCEFVFCEVCEIVSILIILEIGLEVEHIRGSKVLRIRGN